DGSSQQRRGRGDHNPQQEPHGNEQKKRIVQKRPESAGTVAPLRQQSKRQAHQRAERGLDGPEVDGHTSQQENQERGHLLRSRSIKPWRRPPLRRKRASTRDIRPSSLS